MQGITERRSPAGVPAAVAAVANVADVADAPGSFSVARSSEGHGVSSLGQQLLRKKDPEPPGYGGT